MLVVITHLKAPWPAGAAIGDVVDLAVPVLPRWAVGKCHDAPEGAEAAHVWQPPEPAAEPEFVVNPGQPDPGEQARIDAALREAAEAEVAELHQRLADAAAALAEAQAAAAAAVAERDAARAALAEAQAAATAKKSKTTG